MFLQSAMWFAEMSELTDELCWGSGGDHACRRNPEPRTGHSVAPAAAAHPALPKGAFEHSC